MTRLEALQEKARSFHYGRIAKRLTEDEFDQVVEFIDENDQLDHLDFEYKVNRLFLDKTDKPKNYALMLELLIAVNAAAKGRQR